MKRFLTILICCSYSVTSFSQSQTDSIYTRLWSNKDSSIFRSVNKGIFTGTANGHFQLVNKKDTLALDFKSTQTTLTITPDQAGSGKTVHRYTTQTTDTKTILTFEMHAFTNVLLLRLNGEAYSFEEGDGVMNESTPGLIFNYFSEKNTEYLTLYTTSPLELSSTNDPVQSKKAGHSQSGKSSKKISLLTGSTLIFTVTK